MRIFYKEHKEQEQEKKSVAIYHIVKKSNTHIQRKIELEAKIADMFIGDVETKFEYMLFNAPDDTSYIDLYIYFRAEWARILKALDRRNFKYIRINRNHFDNQYAPKPL